MVLPDVEAVYDFCGQASGNTFLQDVVAVLQPEASRQDARLYRIGTAKLAAITAGVDEAETLMLALKALMQSLWITCALPGGRLPASPVGAPGGLSEFLRSQQGVFNATVRARLRTAESSSAT